MKNILLISFAISVLSCQNTKLKQEKIKRDSLRIEYYKLNDEFYRLNENVYYYMIDDQEKSNKYYDSMQVVSKGMDRIYEQMYPKKNNFK